MQLQICKTENFVIATSDSSGSTDESEILDSDDTDAIVQWHG